MKETPFDSQPDLRFLYRSASFDRATEALLSAITRRDGFVLLTGDEGTGKTTICQFIAKELDRRTVTSLIVDRVLTVDELLKTVLLDFGVISKDDLTSGRLTAATREQLMTALKEFLASLSAVQASGVVLIDDAERLPLEVMQHLRVIAEGSGPRLLQIVLVGGPDLPGILDQYELRQLNKDIAVRVQLTPLAANEIRAYVVQRFAVAGRGVPDELDPPAFAAMFNASQGNPKIVNQLCERAFAGGSQRAAGIINAPLIAEAVDASGLPLPRTGHSLLQTALIVTSLIALVFLGAAGAAWVFRDPFTRMVARWQIAPAAPADTVLPQR